MNEDLENQYMTVNQKNWDDRAAIHLESRFYDVEGWLDRKEGPRKDEIADLGDVTGLRLLHLQCHFGLDTLAWVRQGAIVTGLDFSPTAIAAAEDIAARAGLDDRSTFVCANVYEAAETLGPDGFDIVYVSLGALCWLPNVDRWAEQVGALVSPGGRLYMHEQHPLAWALAEDRPNLEYSYFEEVDPFVGESDQTYTDSSRPVAHGSHFEWNHGLGELVTALLRQGLQIEKLVEHDWTVLPRFPWLVLNDRGDWTNPDSLPRVPLTFTLLARRTP